ncbi:hypothetical protein BACERE00185_02544 [Bacillus mobilis]|uniref:Uncharacterized protein n=1 Tax=Bacillus mobilis TaxID=2026190 RepID=A0A1Y5ZQJ6_9BACI|nr:hypothetical protein BACERE00185_02544 [Bacillus mobilis]
MSKDTKPSSGPVTLPDSSVKRPTFEAPPTPRD